MNPPYDGLAHRIKVMLRLNPRPRTAEFNSGSWTKEKVEKIQARSREGQWVEGGTMNVPDLDADEKLERYERWRRGYGDDNE